MNDALLGSMATIAFILAFAVLILSITIIKEWVKEKLKAKQRAKRSNFIEPALIREEDL